MLACGMTKPKNPFSALEAMRDQLVNRNQSGQAHSPDSQPTPGEVLPTKKGPAWAVVRMERKGRGGKEATVIEKLDLPAKQLEQWCRELKQALGCGGTVEGNTIVLQGDLRQRIAPVLEKRGVGKVTIG